jgi:hypothetical protein
VVVAIISFTYATVAATNVRVMTYNVDEGTDFTAIIAFLTSPNPTAAQFQRAVLETKMRL